MREGEQKEEIRGEYLTGALVIREGVGVVVSFTWTVTNTDSVQLTWEENTSTNTKHN